MYNNPYKMEFSDLRLAITRAYRADETESVQSLLAIAELSDPDLARVKAKARDLVGLVRDRRLGKGGLDAFLFEYSLSSQEGIALLCLAEALLRIPDSHTADKLIRDKITSANWEQHVGKSTSTFVNAATWGLILTGKIVSDNATNPNNLSRAIKGLFKRGGESLVRSAVLQAMRILGKQFVMGTTIGKAMQRAAKREKMGFRYSYDMLGEAARTAQDASKYFERYKQAIIEIGAASAGQNSTNGPGISIKLSALHPRYEPTKKQRVLSELLHAVKTLAVLAKQHDIGFTIDAEEADRLDLSLDLMEVLIKDPELAGWDGFGCAVQAYQKRAPYVIDWLVALARKYNRKITIRLVKGAYWDSEIKWAQERGLNGYPVFTRKAATDVSYIACVHKLLASTDVVYSQFATHNAYTVAMVLELAERYSCSNFEFQCLHGMGDALYLPTIDTARLGVPCRVYAPVGGHEHLLAYLVRRLLENGANTSFVNRIVDENLPVEELIADPCVKIKQLVVVPHVDIALPINLYGKSRQNSRGIDLSNPLEIEPLLQFIEQYKAEVPDLPTSIAASEPLTTRNIYQPANRERRVGAIKDITSKIVEQILQQAEKYKAIWNMTDVAVRAKYIEDVAGLLEQERNDFIALLVQESGKTISDAIAEVREAIDFCRYYSQIAREDFLPLEMTGPTGEHNQVTLCGRGVFLCISPWNFPLAIFTGQVVASLLAGNVVVAKPASQTPLIAAKMVDLLHRAGIPSGVVQLMPGSGSKIGNLVVSDQRIKGVMFTGSTETARSINQLLSTRPGAIIPFVAETGGQNAMIVDSSALPEQVVADVLVSAFGSAGQRCSSLRILYLQEDVADSMLQMLVGAMQELVVGDPASFATDIGPVIDQNSYNTLMQHCVVMDKIGTLLYRVPLANNLLVQGNFFAPCVYEIQDIKLLTGEVFGPILHVIRYNAKDLLKVIADINSTGYGLTLGIHSRISEVADFISARANVGNIYVNRSMIGAVVGVQPFGGEGLSGTGPKAGGPRYLHRLATERTLSINTAATGGNTSLMLLQE